MRSTRKFHDDVCNNLFRRNDRADLAIWTAAVPSRTPSLRQQYKQEKSGRAPQKHAAIPGQFQRAAEQDHLKAQNNLAYMYAEGRGFAQDNLKAVEWYTRAAERGYAEAQYNLGFMYEQGRGVPQDYAKAVEWYRKAADQNEPAAQYSLGLMYDQGTGVQRNLSEATRWYRLAAKNGDPDAKAYLRAQNRK